MRRRDRFVGSAHSLEKKKQTNKEMGGLKVPGSSCFGEKKKNGFREKEKRQGFESLARRLEDQTLFFLAQIWSGDSLKGLFNSSSLDCWLALFTIPIWLFHPLVIFFLLS